MNIGNQINKPFDDDLLNLSRLANLWTNALIDIDNNFVIGIDASWGMGKTYFARNWMKMLENQNYQVCYIDAFEYDFSDDPFMVISHNIIEMLKSNNNFTELENIANYLNTLFRAFKNNTIDVLPTIAEGGVLALSNSPSNNPIINGLSKIAGSVVKVLRDSFTEANSATHNPFDSINKKNIQYVHIIKAFKILLEKKVSELVKDTDKPLIIMIDELDRCKPTFAIEFLEKLKHIFDIKNIVFILYFHEKELVSAIRGVYGESFDGYGYLNKFINLKLKLTKTDFIKDENKLKKFILDSIKDIDTAQYNIYDKNLNIINQEQFTSELLDMLLILSNVFHISLRDFLTLKIFYKLITVNNIYNFMFIIIFKIIQLKKPELYSSILNSFYEIENNNAITNYNIQLPSCFSETYKDSKHKYIRAFTIFINKALSSKNQHILTDFDIMYDEEESKKNTINLCTYPILEELIGAAKEVGETCYNKYLARLLTIIDVEIGYIYVD